MNFAEVLPAIVPSWGHVRTVFVIGADADILPDNAKRRVVGESNKAQYIERRQLHIVPTDQYVVPDNQEITNQVELKADLVIHTDLFRRRNISEAMAELAAIDFDCCVIHIDEGTRSGRLSNYNVTPSHRNDKLAFYVGVLKRNFIKYDLVIHRYASCIVLCKGRKYFELDCLED